MSAIRIAVGNLIFLGLASLLLNSCGSTPENTPKVRFAEDEYKEKVSAAGGDTAQHSFTVTISEMKFQPQEIRVKKGDTVVFSNQDMVTHDITEEKTKAWTSNQLPANKSWSLVATQSADYYCSIHPTMKGKIIVQ
jgi:plastocyanin